MTNKQIIELLQTEFPKFSKVQLSMVKNSDKYGIVLCPRAKRLLKRGKSGGVPVKKGDKSRKQLTIRIDPELYTSLKDLMEATGCSTIQDLVAIKLEEAVNESAQR